MALHARLQAERPHLRVLASLDDLGQACYTAGHGTDACDLDDVADHDLPALDPALMEYGEYIGSLTSPTEFPIDLAAIAGLLDWDTPISTPPNMPPR